MKNDFLKNLLAQQKRIREDFKQLAKIYPGAFTKDNKPIVATATFPDWRTK